ncbi:MAG: TRAP transporter large permease subunit [Bacillota bacterium]
MRGTILPPIGVVFYVTSHVARVSFDRVARGTAPLLVPLRIVLFMIPFIPKIMSFLPRLLLGIEWADKGRAQGAEPAVQAPRPLAKSMLSKERITWGKRVAKLRNNVPHSGT